MVAILCNHHFSRSGHGNASWIVQLTIALALRIKRAEEGAIELEYGDAAAAVLSDEDQLVLGVDGQLTIIIIAIGFAELTNKAAVWPNMDNALGFSIGDESVAIGSKPQALGKCYQAWKLGHQLAVGAEQANQRVRKRPNLVIRADCHCVDSVRQLLHRKQVLEHGAFRRQRNLRQNLCTLSEQTRRRPQKTKATTYRSVYRHNRRCWCWWQLFLRTHAQPNHKHKNTTETKHRPRPQEAAWAWGALVWAGRAWALA